MKTVIAIDSFKGSLSSMEAGTAAKEGILRACEARVCVRPLADGGEGTMEALTEGMGGRFVETEVRGPLGGKVRARYGILEDGVTAVMEMAQASGIMLVRQEELDPRKATTWGVGEMIKDAVERGCRRFIMGIGGSATTDGGAGMLSALGFEFLDGEGRPIGPGIEDLDRIEEVRDTQKLSLLDECEFQIACDVKNPLCGEKGAVFVYGPQKGVKEEEKEVFDEKMRHYAKKASEYAGADFSEEPGAGAAGGLGFAFLSFFPHAVLSSGIDLVLRETGLEEEIKDADIVITGEGRLDEQTAMGKAPAGVARLAGKYGKKVIAFAGGVTEGALKCHEAGIDAFFPIVRGVTTLEEAMDKEKAKRNMTLAAEQVFRLICCFCDPDTEKG